MSKKHLQELKLRSEPRSPLWLDRQASCEADGGCKCLSIAQ